ncbi:33 kDa ribonucleoprotein, chloroplastic [Capsicum chacoense]
MSVSSFSTSSSLHHFKNTSCMAGALVHGTVFFSEELGLCTSIKSKKTNPHLPISPILSSLNPSSRLQLRMIDSCSSILPQTSCTAGFSEELAFFPSIKLKKTKPHLSMSPILSSFNQSSRLWVRTIDSCGPTLPRTSCTVAFSEEVAFFPSIKLKKTKPHLPISPILSSFNTSSRLQLRLIDSCGPILRRTPCIAVAIVHRTAPFSASALSDGADEAALSLEEESEEEEDEEEKEGDGGGVVDEPKSIEDGRLYVGNLPFSMTPSQLSEIFTEAGQVANVEVVYDRVTDRSRGFAFVTMGSVEEAKEAIRLFDGSQVGGRTVKVNFPEVPRGGEREVMSAKMRSTYQGFVDSPHKLYVSNLSWNLTSQGLRDAFADQPGFMSAKVIYDRGSGRSRGFGFITFSSAEEMNNALDTMNEVDVEGRPLRLNVSAQRAPVSSPPVVETSPGNDSEDDDILSSISS